MSGNEVLPVVFSKLLIFSDFNLSAESIAISNDLHNASCFELMLSRDAEPNTPSSNSKVNQGILGSFCPKYGTDFNVILNILQ